MMRPPTGTPDAMLEQLRAMTSHLGPWAAAEITRLRRSVARLHQEAMAREAAQPANGTSAAAMAQPTGGQGRAGHQVRPQNA